MSMEEKDMKKVISIKSAKYERMYKEFFANVNNQELSKSVFFKCDVRIEKAKNTKIS
jgi:hypothetical protein